MNSTNPEIISILSSIYGNKLNDVKKGVGEAIEDLKKTKEKLDKYMEEKDYDSLEYFVDSLPYP